jgi:hypothetical protein
MKIKIGDNIYESNREPIMVIMSKEERKQIAEMPENYDRYCQYPDTDEWTGNNFKKIRT